MTSRRARDKFINFPRDEIEKEVSQPLWNEMFKNVHCIVSDRLYKKCFQNFYFLVELDMDVMTYDFREQYPQTNTVSGRRSNA